MQKLSIISGIIAALIIFLGSLSFVVVDAGYVGVVKRLGAVQPTFYLKDFISKLQLSIQ